MEELIKFGYPSFVSRTMNNLTLKMENSMYSKVDADKKVWFSMWFLASIATFGLAFFPMFHRLINNRNNHFQREANLENKIVAYLKEQGKEPPATSPKMHKMNSKAWTASVVLVIPVFVITYLLSKDLLVHEENQDRFLARAFPERMFMPQTIPIKTYALITILTLGVGIIYWLYKIINMYNAHFKAHLQVEKEIAKLMEEK
jgi:hypothetical protein